MSYPERQNCESYTKEGRGGKKAAETLYNIVIDQLPSKAATAGESREPNLCRDASGEDADGD